MGRTSRTATRLSAAAAGLALLAAPLAATPAQAARADEQPAARAGAKVIDVMTRNLYLGADIMRPIAAMQSVPAEPQDSYVYRVLDAVAHATDDTHDIAVETDFGVRVKLLAAELATEQPDLVGLQEVSLWRTGPMDTNPADILVPNATEVQWDFLKMLLAEARAQGVKYKAVNVNTLSDVEAPAYRGTITDPASLTEQRDVRLTMRDVILKRKGSGMKILSSKKRTFAAAMELPQIAGKSFDFKRGYQWVNVRKKGAGKFRFINSHFEAFSSDIALAQAKEVVSGPGSYKGTTVFVCDCNSDPLDGSVKTGIGDTQRHWAPYWWITSQWGRFFDTWLQIKEPHEGWTSGLNEKVDADTPDGFDHRIDMVFARTGDGKRVKALAGTIVGNELADRDPVTGLWPSEHAGVLMRLRLP